MKKPATILGLLAIFLLSCTKEEPTASHTKPFTVEASLSTNTIFIGELVDLQLAIHHPSAGQFQEPDFGRSKEISLEARTKNTFRSDEHYEQTLLNYKITSWTVGNHILLTNTLIYLEEDGTHLEASSEELTLQVISSLEAGDTEFRDLKGLAFWPKVFPKWILALIIPVLIALLVYALLIRRQATPLTPRAPPPPPPPEIALRELEVLLNTGMLDREEVEPFYVQLSNIVRSYVENRYDLHAPEQTTEEFIRETTNSQLLSLDHRTLLGNFLLQADLVKFAKHHPGKSDMVAAYEAGKRFVLETVPVPAESEGET